MASSALGLRRCLRHLRASTSWPLPPPLSLIALAPVPPLLLRLLLWLLVLLVLLLALPLLLSATGMRRGLCEVVRLRMCLGTPCAWFRATCGHCRRGEERMGRGRRQRAMAANRE